MVTQQYNYLRFVEYKTFIDWTVKNYTDEVTKSKYKIEKLGKHTNHATEKIKLFDFPNDTFGILGISNDIGMFDAYEEKGSNINQPYKKVEDGYLAYNPYRVNVGSIGMKTDVLKYSYISPAYVVFSCKETLLPDFLYKLMKTDKFNQLIIKNTTGSVRQTLIYNNLANISIPLPPLTEQERIISTYNKTINQAIECENKASKLEQSVDKILFAELGLEEIKETPNTDSKYKYLKFVEYKKLTGWSVGKNSKPVSPQTIFHSNKYENVMLTSYADINPKTSFNNTCSDDTVISFLPMECISDIYGEIMYEFEGTPANSKGYTRFIENDILWAKITPCMQNGKCAIASNLKNKCGYGSTEYHVIRNKSNEISNEYLYCFLRTKIIREVAQLYFSGSAGQQRVGADFLENIKIPLPPLEIQNQIANKIFDIKNQIKQLRNISITLRDQAKKEFEEEIFCE